MQTPPMKCPDGRPCYTRGCTPQPGTDKWCWRVRFAETMKSRFGEQITGFTDDGERK
jgi:hypothetical protein